MNIYRLVICCLFLVACSTPAATPEPTPTARLILVPSPTPTNTPEPTSTPEPALVTAQEVVDLFVEAGLELSEVEPGTRREGSPLPNSYREHLRFVIPEVAPRGAQLFVCDEKYLCDALYEYFIVMKGLAGPYTYQSAGGTVVIQLNSGLTPDTAAKFQEIVESIP